MEPKFQTSFIPKKPNVVMSGTINAGAPQKPKVHATSFFMAIGVMLFIVSLLALGGAYFWKYYLSDANKKFKEDLASREKQFNVQLIEQLKAINVQIDSAKSLVDKHVAFSSVFDVLQRFTISEVRFLSMDFKSSPESNGNLTIGMSGQGKNLAAVAFQSDVLADLDQYGLTKVVKNPLLSDPTLESNGSVSFGFSAEIDGESMTYKKAVSGDLFDQDTQ